jgi:hypothetical protein
LATARVIRHRHNDLRFFLARRQQHGGQAADDGDDDQHPREVASQECLNDPARDPAAMTLYIRHD